MIAKTKTALALASLLALAATPALADTGCAKLDEAAAKGLFDKWAAALPGHNADLVLAFYADGHSFKPHDRDAALTERTAIRDYWTDFVDGTPRVTLGEATVAADCGKVVKSGVKTIAVGGEEIRAAFAMEFADTGGTWLITRHEITPLAN